MRIRENESRHSIIFQHWPLSIKKKKIEPASVTIVVKVLS